MEKGGEEGAGGDSRRIKGWGQAPRAPHGPAAPPSTDLSLPVSRYKQWYPFPCGQDAARCFIRVLPGGVEASALGSVGSV